MVSSVTLKSDKTLWVWGYNQRGQLCDGTTTDKNTPIQESTGATNWSNIVAGTAHTVALKSSGTQPTPTSIPTVSSWGLAALAAALLMITIFLLQRTSDLPLGPSDLPPIVVPLLMLVQPRSWALCSRWSAVNSPLWPSVREACSPMSCVA